MVVDHQAAELKIVFQRKLNPQDCFSTINILVDIFNSTWFPNGGVCSRIVPPQPRLWLKWASQRTCWAAWEAGGELNNGWSEYKKMLLTTFKQVKWSPTISYDEHEFAALNCAEGDCFWRELDHDEPWRGNFHLGKINLTTTNLQMARERVSQMATVWIITVKLAWNNKKIPHPSEYWNKSQNCTGKLNWGKEREMESRKKNPKECPGNLGNCKSR